MMTEPSQEPDIPTELVKSMFLSLLPFFIKSLLIC